MIKIRHKTMSATNIRIKSIGAEAAAAGGGAMP